MNSSRSLAGAMALAVMLFFPVEAAAHCDALDGPVVKAAIAALDAGDVALVLIWVHPEGEAEIRGAFANTLSVRGLNAAARTLADRYFFETLVRVHRAGEGAPFTGLKPAGTPHPAIAAADRALDGKDVKPLTHMLTTALGTELARHFEEAVRARHYDRHDVEAGRHFVQAYVEYIHFVERVHEAISTAAHGHFVEPPRR